MDKNAKKAIAKNRVKLLSLDYFDLTGPLLAADLLPSKKHKEIKSEANNNNKARVDLLLEWIDENAPADALPAFLQGIRNCQENMLAKKIKKDASDGGGDLVKKPAAPKITKPPVSYPGIAAAANFPKIPTGKSPIAAGDKSKVKTPKPKKPKTDVKPIIPSLSVPFPFNGLDLPGLPLLPPPAPASASRKRKSGAGDNKPKTPKTPNLNGTPKPGDDMKIVTKSAPKTTTPKKSNEPKIKLPKILAAADKGPRFTRKSSTSDKGDDGAKDKKPIIKKKATPAAAGAADPSKSPKPTGKAKVMTFKEVETKQIDCRQKFRFKNPNAVVKVINFKDKTDISYLGCPFEESGKVCEKRVELKSKEFVCESRHRNATCKQIPRLNITCNDNTADLELTLLKNNVEVFCGKSAAELGTMSVNEIKDALDTTVGKKFTVDVHCEKMKKAAKKSGVPKWNNLASIWGNDDGATPAKKKRKN